MNQNSFMVDCFKASDKVTVNARELQKILQDKYRVENELRVIYSKLELANALLAAKSQEITVSLDVKV